MSLTVLLPTIGRPTLRRAVESVLNQTVPCDLRVSHDVERIGAGPMLNKLVQGVTTTWVSTFADDDVLMPTFHERLLQQFQTYDLIIFQMMYVGGAKLPITTDPAALRFGQVGCSYAVKTEVARRHWWLGQPCTNMIAEDWDMISSVRDADGAILIVPEVQYLVRPAA